ncbi:MAG: nucleotidyltransferase domain-containing protein [Nanoarchaeota archaeon]
MLFGSVVRGKYQPKDIDILILFSFKEDIEVEFSLRKSLENVGKHFHVIGISYEKMFDASFVAREDVFSDGYSFRKKEFLSSAFGYACFYLFKYSLKGKTDSEKMRFHYGLYGRGGEKGVLFLFNAVKFGNLSIICPLEKSDSMTEFFEKWKLDFERIKILIPKQMIKRIFE